MFHQRTHTSSQSARQLNTQSSQFYQIRSQSQSIEITHNEQLHKTLIEFDILLRLQTAVVFDTEFPDHLYAEILPRCPEIVKQQGLHVQLDRLARRPIIAALPVEELVGSSQEPIEPPPLPVKKRKTTSTRPSTPTSTTPTTTTTSALSNRWVIAQTPDDLPDSTTSIKLVRALQ